MPEHIPVKNPEVVGRIIRDEAVLVLPVKGQVKVLNEVGARIWSLIDGTCTAREIAAVIHAEFTVNSDEAIEDTLAFLQQLSARGIITMSDENRG